jgi:hypothetical protein
MQTKDSYYKSDVPHPYNSTSRAATATNSFEKVAGQEYTDAAKKNIYNTLYTTDYYVHIAIWHQGNK